MKLCFFKMLWILCALCLPTVSSAAPCEAAEQIERYDYNEDGVLNRADAEDFRQDLQITLRQKSGGSSESLKLEETSQNKSTNTQIERLDINQDRQIDVLDSIQFFKIYRQCSTDGDINRDGLIDVQDLQVLMGVISAKEGQLEHHDLNADGLLNLKDVMHFRDMLCRMYEPKQLRSIRTEDGVGRWMVQRCRQLVTR